MYMQVAGTGEVCHVCVCACVCVCVCVCVQRSDFEAVAANDGEGCTVG